MEQTKATMKNTIVNMAFYRKKSIMMMDVGTTVDFNTCGPFISIKFATRVDENSKGNWDENNIFYFTNYQTIYDFAARLKTVVMSPNETPGDANFSNPAKQKGIFVRKSVADGGKVYITCTFYIGPKDSANKINVSLSVEEANSIVAFLGSFINNYPVIAQGTLSRRDVWFDLYRKGGQSTDKPAQQQQSSYQNKNSGKPAQQQQVPPPKEPEINQSMIDSLESEFGQIGGNSLEDVPF